MTTVRIIQRPAFSIAGQKTWISGPDNQQFGQFWQQARAAGLFDAFDNLKRSSGAWAGPHTGAAVLGVSRVEQDPANRAFHYMIAIETGDLEPAQAAEAGLEAFEVPASTWAVFECHGKPPDSIVAAEMFAFMQWLPKSGCEHALAPEMEVYPANAEETYCEFWLPVVKKD
jgi:AraC family transcriptional regulator